MSSRWRERKGGTFVSASELAARKKALLAPVQKWKKAWVQPSPHSSYKVLRWVPRNSVPGSEDPSIGGTILPYDDPFALDASDDGASSSSSDDEDVSDVVVPVVVGPDGNPSASPETATKKLKVDREGESREARLERKMNKAFAAAERGGAQLAGLETGETAEDIVAKQRLLPHSGGPTSGTVTPAESSTGLGSLATLGGLDGGAAAKAEPVRSRLGIVSETGTTTTPAVSGSTTPGSVTPPVVSQPPSSSLTVPNAPTDPSPLRKEETVDEAMTAAVEGEAAAEEEATQDVEMPDAVEDEEPMTMTVEEVLGGSSPPAPPPQASELPDAGLNLPPPEPDLSAPVASPSAEATAGPDSVQPVDATEASALLVGEEEGGEDVVEGVQQGLDGKGATEEEMQEQAEVGMGVGSVS